MGNLADMHGLQEMGSFTDETEAITGYTSTCEEYAAVAIELAGLWKPGHSQRTIIKRNEMKGTILHEKVICTSV